MMRLPRAVAAGVLFGVAPLVCGVSVSLWFFPFGSITSMEDIATVETLLSFQSFFMLPALSAGVGLVSGLLGIRKYGLAGVIAVSPVVAVFVSGTQASEWSIGLAALFIVLAWVTARLAGNTRASKGSDSLLHRRDVEGTSRRMEVLRQRDIRYGLGKKWA
jgi:hypothetical protein